MIHLITLNPAIDNFIEIDKVEINKTNYSKNQYLKFGGKACNVSVVLKQLQIDNVLITATSEDNNEFIEKSLQDLDIKLIMTDIIRINTKVSIDSQITELNSIGVPLSISARNEFLKYIEANVKKNDHVLVAGNPHPNDFKFMIDLCIMIKDITKYLYLDSSKITLEDLAAIKPYFIKPNEEEFEYLVSQKVDYENISELSEKILKYVDNVMVSLGKDGIFFKNKQVELKTKPIIGQVVNTVGAGDSTVAATLYCMSENKSVEEMMKYAAACGSATAFSKDLASIKEIESLYEKVELEYIHNL